MDGSKSQSKLMSAAICERKLSKRLLNIVPKLFLVIRLSQINSSKHKKLYQSQTP